MRLNMNGTVILEKDEVMPYCCVHCLHVYYVVENSNPYPCPRCGLEGLLHGHSTQEWERKDFDRND